MLLQCRVCRPMNTSAKSADTNLNNFSPSLPNPSQPASKPPAPKNVGAKEKSNALSAAAPACSSKAAAFTSPITAAKNTTKLLKKNPPRLLRPAAMANLPSPNPNPQQPRPTPGRPKLRPQKLEPTAPPQVWSPGFSRFSPDHAPHCFDVPCSKFKVQGSRFKVRCFFVPFLSLFTLLPPVHCS